jgi:hypothetical protein
VSVVCNIAAGSSVTWEATSSVAVVSFKTFAAASNTGVASTKIERVINQMQNVGNG